MRLTSALAALTSLAALTACTVELTEPTPAPGRVVVRPAAAVTPVRSTTVTTVRAPDGTTVVTTVSPDKATPSFAGTWHTRADDRLCEVTLLPDADRQMRRATTTCLSDQLFELRGWQQRGASVALLSAFGEDIATLRPTEAGMLEGGGLKLWR